MMKVTVLNLITLSLATVFALGCDQVQTNSAPDTQVATITVEAHLGGPEPEFILSNGVSVSGYADYTALIGDVLSGGTKLQGVQIAFDDLSEDTELNNEGVAQQPLHIPIPGTPYHVVTTWHQHYVGGCIRRVVSHWGFLINRDPGGLVADLHIAFWTENGRPCFGAYNSASGWCRSQCGPSYGDISAAISGALISAGVVAWVANAMAAILTPVAVAGVTL